MVQWRRMKRIAWEARLLHGAPFAVVALDELLNVVAWNDAAARMFGVGEAEALGAAVTRVIGGEAAAWQGLLAGGTVRTTVGPREIEWTGSPERDDAGQLLALACYGQDVTAKLAAERQCRVERQMLRALMDNLEIVAWAMRRDGLCTYHDGRGISSIGLERGAFVGKNIHELFPQQSGASPFDRVFAGETVYLEGGTHGQMFNNWMIPIRDEAGQVELMAAVSLNVTEQRAGEQALRDRLAEIEAQQRTIRELSTPIIEVWDRVLTLPILGMVDAGRAAEIMENLLLAVTAKRARFAILDLTGVKEIDAATAGHLLGMVRAIRLLGAEGVITGIHPSIAQTIVNLGVELPNLIVHATLRGALQFCIARLGR